MPTPHYVQPLWTYRYIIGAVVALILAVAVIRAKTSEDTVKLPQPPLKTLAARHNITVGNFAIRNHLQDPKYSQILTQDYNLALADNTPNWYFTDGGLRPSRTEYSFDHMDQVVQFATQHGMQIQAHHLLWGEEKWLPQWLTTGNYTAEQLSAIIQEHIQTVTGRYANQIQQWTVVNEAFSRGQHIYGLHDWWADHTGGKAYIDNAFRWARAADSDAILILNDFGNESLNPISDEMYAYIKDAKARNVPIDGIGMQMHIDGTHPPTKDEVITNMKRFGDLGVSVYVTEFDVNMNDVQADGQDKDQIAGSIYYEMARACIESKVCKSFSILGITDKETWYNYMGLTDPRPLPFDTDYQPKPAYHALRSAFSEP